MKRLVVAMICMFALCSTNAIGADGIIIVPAQEFTIMWTPGTNSSGTILEKRTSEAGEWESFLTVENPTDSVTDTLEDTERAQYRAQAYRTVDGIGSMVYSTWSDPSDWAIAAAAPGCPSTITISQ